MIFFLKICRRGLFRKFLTSEIPTEVDESISYGVKEITSICIIFKLSDGDDILED